MATSESDASMLSADFCEDSDFFNEDESSDGFTIVTENMETMNLRDDKGMWMLKVLNASGSFRKLLYPINLCMSFHACCLDLFANAHSQLFV